MDLIETQKPQGMDYSAHYITISHDRIMREWVSSFVLKHISRHSDGII